MTASIDGVVQPWHLVHLDGLMMSGAELVIMEAAAVEALGRGTYGTPPRTTNRQEQALTRLVEQLRQSRTRGLASSSPILGARPPPELRQDDFPPPAKGVPP